MPEKRSVKIVATLGPSSSSEQTIQELIEAGVNVFRLNFSHGTHEEHAERIKLIRRLSAECDQPVAILQDLQGPKIRVGELPGKEVTLREGKQVFLSVDGGQTAPLGKVIIPVDFSGFPSLVTPGKRILLDDGRLELETIQVIGRMVEARVILGGTLRPNKGINVPGVPLPLDGFTSKDRHDLRFGITNGVDAVAISFVRTPKDVIKIRRAVAEISPERAGTPLIAKLERPEALEHLDQILDAADGVMVARGDLGIEMSPEDVPIAQKRIIAQANRHAKFVITATQMLETMMHNPRPTRAEASDVANAVFDGTDAVMLSGETAAGEYPVLSVKQMDAIVRKAEENASAWSNCVTAKDPSQEDAVTITRAAREIANDRNVAAIAVFTQTGRTAIFMSKARPQVPILAFTPHEDTWMRMSMYWGVSSYLIPFAHSVEEMLEIVDTSIRRKRTIQEGSQVVVISGFPVSSFHSPNFALLHTIGEIEK